MRNRLNSAFSDFFEATYLQWIAVGIGLVVLVRLVIWIRTSLREDDDPASVAHQMLSEMGELQRQGEITGTEYRSIKGRLVDKLNSEQENTSQNSEENNSVES